MQSSIPKIIITVKLSLLMDSTRGTTAHLLGSDDFERATAVTGITVSHRCCLCSIHDIFFEMLKMFVKTEWIRRTQVVFSTIKL